ncbi:MAG: hypothetical protein AVO39_10375 [delta proteobacterium MLS_D]|jgi:hypothetical protein|nr:MAG: hypothetical protein AVO39_10375 [delta proteobacterium MLS_D]
MEKHPNPSLRWTNRRRMAWASVVAGLAYPILVAVTKSELLVDIAGPFYIFIGGLSGVYVGFATLDDKWRKP